MKKKLFMLKKLFRDFHQVFTDKPVYKISDLLNSEILEYPFVFLEAEIASGKKQRLISCFDGNGIPLIRSYIDVDDSDLHYYPITIGQVGISIYQSYLSDKSDENKKRFLKFVTWFLENKKSDTIGTFWLTYVPKPEYNVFSPWKSAFTQSRAVSILLRGYHLTKNEKLLKIIDDALNVYSISYDKGGVSVFTEKGNIIYEEYVAKKPTRVLDGHIFSLFGLIDILKYSSNLPLELVQKAQGLFDLGVNALVEMLPFYDMGYWFQFSLTDVETFPKIDPCTVTYMKLITIQLELLSHLTKKPELNYYCQRAKSYLTLRNSVKSYRIKYKALKKLNRV